MSTFTMVAKTTSPGPSTSLSTATATKSVGPSSSFGAGYQFPICNIRPKCMKNGTNKPMCDHLDFKCICIASNSLVNNTQFDQQCVLDDCTGDIGKEEFIAYLIYQCRLADKTLIDIPKQWEPYLPPSYQTKDASPSPSATTTVITALPVNYAPAHSITDGAKAGIGMGALFAVIILAALGITFYRAKKKVKQVQKRNAELVDQQSAHGVSAYIRNLKGKSTASLTEGGTTVIGEPPFKVMKDLPQSPTLAKATVPWSENPGDLQRQCSKSDYGDEASITGQAPGGSGMWGEAYGGDDDGH
ncbi:hypothetical protein NX059_004457 [Plenodomus lindquistii]|nr:hypothetical protein NX059_004457 [Plenodomus lindquistii]